MIRKLCVFPNDPLSAYLKKGEIKERYFNPKNIFDEIHVISLFDSDEKEENVKEVAGNAKLKIHVLGKINLLNKNKKRLQVMNLVQQIKPDVIRSFNPLLQGWIGANLKKELGIPYVISLHGDYDRDLRHYARKNHNLPSYLKLKYTEKTMEPFSIKNADEIIIVYEFIREYAKKMGARSINLIYNKVDLSKFSPNVKPAFVETKPIVICVGRLMSEKNQECLIKAIKDLDVILLLVGDGPDYDRLTKLVEQLGLDQKVRFERSIPNKDIPGYYAAAQVFALPIKYGGFAIPALEAASSGLPVILPKQKTDPEPDLIKDFAMLIDNNPESFRDGIARVLEDSKLRQNMIKLGFETMKKIHSEIMEEKERDLYMALLQKS